MKGSSASSVGRPRGLDLLDDVEEAAAAVVGHARCNIVGPLDVPALAVAHQLAVEVGEHEAAVHALPLVDLRSAGVEVERYVGSQRVDGGQASAPSGSGRRSRAARRSGSMAEVAGSDRPAAGAVDAAATATSTPAGVVPEGAVVAQPASAASISQVRADAAACTNRIIGSLFFQRRRGQVNTSAPGRVGRPVPGRGDHLGSAQRRNGLTARSGRCAKAGSAGWQRASLRTQAW